MGVSSKKLETIVYYERYVVIQSGIRADKGQNAGDLLTEEEYLDILETLPKDNQYLPDDDPTNSSPRWVLKQYMICCNVST